MRIGTKSVLYGAHCFFLHPWFVAWAWTRLYGFPWDPRLWVAFFVHDLGYWGKPNMDGPEGEKHVEFGANLMHRLFDPEIKTEEDEFWDDISDHFYRWGYLCRFHSRYWAKKSNVRPSPLCYADKLAFVLTPSWLYLPLVWLTGEWREYATAHDHEVHYGSELSLLGWYYPSRDYVRRWVEEHKDGREDTWTAPKPITPVMRCIYCGTTSPANGWYPVLALGVISDTGANVGQLCNDCDRRLRAQAPTSPTTGKPDQERWNQWP